MRSTGRRGVHRSFSTPRSYTYTLCFEGNASPFCTLARTYVLGDRWQVSISGNSVRIVTNTSLGGHSVSPVTIEARRP